MTEISFLDFFPFPDAWLFGSSCGWVVDRVDGSVGGCVEEAITGPVVGIVMVIGINVGINLIGLKGESN